MTYFPFNGKLILLSHFGLLAQLTSVFPWLCLNFFISNYWERQHLLWPTVVGGYDVTWSTVKSKLSWFSNVAVTIDIKIHLKSNNLEIFRLNSLWEILNGLATLFISDRLRRRKKDHVTCQIKVGKGLATLPNNNTAIEILLSVIHCCQKF